MTPEGRVKKSIMDWLYLQPGCVPFPIPLTGIFDPRTNKFRKAAGRKGTPDILCCWYSYFVSIECKSPVGKPTKDQLEIGRQIKTKGQGIWIIARSIEDVILGLEPYKLFNLPKYVKRKSEKYSSF